ncbi:hypothetical protein DVH24_015854 [Malus domestica]|uniref:Uncharacterized protein n=1 Tax=Malus domestica TaxID=3750 RepID=A0A498JG57_MALDO|nr:hypothetical protein DVH24_015854 [Malus domestica]
MVFLQCDMNMILLQLDSKNALSSSLHVATIFVWLQICFGTYTAVEVRTGDDDHKTKMRASFSGALSSCLRLLEPMSILFSGSVPKELRDYSSLLYHWGCYELSQDKRKKQGEMDVESNDGS